MSEKLLLCIEISGESGFQKVLYQSGWSGKDYPFHWNPKTNTHMRAYHRLEDYRAERADLHKSRNIWPLLANLLPVDQIDRNALIGKAPEPAEAPERRGPGRPPKNAQ